MGTRIKAVLTCTHNLCFSKNKKKITIVHLKMIIFTAVKNLSILHRRDIVIPGHKIQAPRLYEPRCEKNGLRGFRLGPTQTRLYNHTRWLEA